MKVLFIGGTGNISSYVSKLLLEKRFDLYLLNLVYIPSEFLNKCDNQVGSSLLGDKSHSMIFDNSKIKQFVPEFKATIPFSEGIKRVLEWFEADPKRKIIDESINEGMDRIISLYKNNRNL